MKYCFVRLLFIRNVFFLYFINYHRNLTTFCSFFSWLIWDALLDVFSPLLLFGRCMYNF